MTVSFLTRRTFIGTGLAAGVAMGGSVLACGGTSDAFRAALHRLDVFRDTIVAANSVGRIAQIVSGMGNLLTRASLNSDIHRALRTECTSTRLAFLQARAEADFSAGHYLVCARFVISETEYVVAGLTQNARQSADTISAAMHGAETSTSLIDRS